MAKFNGASILLYINGTEVACQKGLSINLDRKLFSTTNKQSGGWDEHGNGNKSSNIPFSALQSTTGLSGNDLLDLIIGASSALLVINGFTYPYVGEVDLQNTQISAPQDEAVTLQGTFAINGKLYRLAGDTANKITDPDGGGSDYDTLTTSGIKITSAINASGAKSCVTNTFAVSDGDVLKLFIYLTLTSGQAPQVIIDGTSLSVDGGTLVAGLNVVTMTMTDDEASAVLKFLNSAAANWSTSNIYLCKA